MSEAATNMTINGNSIPTSLLLNIRLIVPSPSGFASLFKDLTSFK
jgi:hypothetical protein